MGLRGMSLGSILIILLIVLVLFGTKRFRNIGGDLGSAFRSFRNGLKETEEEANEADSNKP
jgi:sec-independent protein translocase protein TatA